MVWLTTSVETKIFVIKPYMFVDIQFKTVTVSSMLNNFVNKWLSEQKFVLKVHGFVNNN